MAESSLPPLSPLRGLLEVSRLVRAQVDLPELLGAIARTISESLGYKTVAVNLYRPAWDDFYVTTVHGNDEARSALIDRARSGDEWQTLLLDRYLRRGAYVILAGEFDWSQMPNSYTPQRRADGGDGAWDPDDALFLPMRHSAGHLLGILSVDEPLSGRRPTDEELDVLVALADHAAQAVQAAQEATEAAKHRLALEQLLSISSHLTAEPLVDEILRAVCSGVRDALGFENVLAMLRDQDTGLLTSRAAVGWSIDALERDGPMYMEQVAPLLDPQFDIEGCYLLPSEEALRRVPRDEKVRYRSERNGLGPFGWSHHWLVVPLLDTAGEVIGILWADEPEDRLVPSSEKLQALRIFANQASAALVASNHRNELRFLADHDPLTRLLNRRAFVERLDAEVARATRYGRSFSLVVGDLDGFKGLNDRFGHTAGDEALQAFARILNTSLRRQDDAFRIGGDEFALMLAETPEADAREVVGRIVEHLAATDGELVTGIRASFGVASYPADAADAQSLFRRADEALYAAKRDGSGMQFAA